MSLISKLTTYARSPQGQSTISRLVASRSGGTARGRAGRRAPASGGGLSGLAGSLLGGQAARGRGRRGRRF